MSRSSYDVVIIGAGPGGLRCAYQLAQSKKSVLVLEKNRIIGPKVCAGGVRDADCERLEIPEEFFGAEVDAFGYTTVDRAFLGQHQRAQLNLDNTTVRTGVRVTEIRKHSLICDTEEEIAFNFLVGADGSTSLVRKHLGLLNRYVLLCLQCKIPREQFIFRDTIKTLQYTHHQALSPWYIYIFPHKQYYIAGGGCGRGLMRPREIKACLRQWITTLTTPDYTMKFEGFPIACDYQGHAFGNKFLVGDAAGFTCFATGEGIYQALVSGEEVAKTILNPSYESPRIAAILEEKQEVMEQFLPKVENAYTAKWK